MLKPGRACPLNTGVNAWTKMSLRSGDTPLPNVLLGIVIPKIEQCITKITFSEALFCYSLSSFRIFEDVTREMFLRSSCLIGFILDTCANVVFFMGKVCCVWDN